MVKTDVHFASPFWISSCCILACFVPRADAGNWSIFCIHAESSNRSFRPVVEGMRCNDSSSSNSDDFDPLVNDYATQVVVIVQYCTVSTLINVFGIVSNIINVVVFIKQGFNETINISLIGLSISDCFSLLALQWLNICFSPLMQTSDISFVSLEVAYVTGGWPRMAFTRITAWITAFITFEKCICIALPLKIKMIITPRRTLTIIVTIFVVCISSIVPSYFTSRLTWKFVPERNRTVYGLVFSENRHEVDRVSFVISNVFLPVMAFAIVVICTVILAIKLNSKSKWREQSASKVGQLTNKDNKIIKMVSLISTIFIISFFPNAIVFSAMAYEPEFNLDGKYRNIFLVVGANFFFLESVNSSINILLYLKMSTKFRNTFKNLICTGSV